MDQTHIPENQDSGKHMLLQIWETKEVQMNTNTKTSGMQLAPPARATTSSAISVQGAKPDHFKLQSAALDSLRTTSGRDHPFDEPLKVSLSRARYAPNPVLALEFLLSAHRFPPCPELTTEERQSSIPSQRESFQISNVICRLLQLLQPL